MSAMSSPEDSWVIDHDSDDNHDSITDSEDDTRRLLQRRSVPRRTVNSRSSITPGKTSKRSTRASVEPEFQMPSIHQDDPRSSPSVNARSNAESARRRVPLAGQSKSQTTKKRNDSSNSPPQANSSITTILTHDLLFPTLQFGYTTLALIMGFLKPILSVVIALWVIAYLLRLTFTTAVSSTLTPICKIPGVSLLHLPFCYAPTPHGPVEFDQLMNVQSAFEDILTSSTGGVNLPVDMKRGEASIRDLKHVVQYSTLPSRNELVFEFTGFIDTARQASADLTRFNSRIGRAVDRVLSTNHYTLQVIEGVAEREAARGAVGKFFQGTVMAPFRTAKLTEELLLDQYLQHTRSIEEQIAELILEAQALLGILQNLDDRLDLIHGITTRDGISVSAGRDELLAQLWTKLGGNRSTRKKQDDQLSLLHSVGVYRRTAWDHVSSTVLKLQAIAANLEDLRERVGAPEVVGVSASVPLKLHIEHIQMGVERLEEQREQARSVEGEQYRRILDKSGQHADESHRYIDGKTSSRPKRD